jgi:ABC-type Zn uptake system ZnuABC Zn-binding protein ZnuA
VETTEGLALLEGESELGEEYEEPFDPHTWISPFLTKQQAYSFSQLSTEG